MPDPTPDRPAVPPPVALRDGQPVVLGEAAPSDRADIAPWANAAARVEAALQAQEAGYGAAAWAMVAFFAWVATGDIVGRSHAMVTAIALASIVACLVAAVWLYRAPRAEVLAGIGAVAIATAVWLLASFGIAPIVLIGGALYWGIRRLIQAWRFRQVLTRETTAAHLHEVGRAVEDLRRDRAHPDAIALRISDRRLASRWRLMLLPDVALVLQKSLGAVFLAAVPKSALTIAPTGARTWSGRPRVRVLVGQQPWDPMVTFLTLATMTEAHLQRYQAWHSATMPDHIRIAIHRKP